LKILSVDTSSNICSVAILEDKNLIKEISLNNGLTHSEKLMPIIKQILEELKINLQEIDLLVCDKGPGSFTGIRIGTSTVMAFSDSLNIKSIGISSLEALAYNVKQERNYLFIN
jgi:tRNA threonylcarbamoyladenosine biosynthesis protein TsaB